MALARYHGLTALDLTSLAHLTCMGNWFLCGCAGLTALDLTPLTHFTNVGDSFLGGCSGLTALDVAPLTHLTSVGNGFLYGCAGVTALDLTPGSGWLYYFLPDSPHAPHEHGRLFPWWLLGVDGIGPDFAHPQLISAGSRFFGGSARDGGRTEHLTDRLLDHIIRGTTHPTDTTRTQFAILPASASSNSRGPDCMRLSRAYFRCKNEVLH